MARGLPRLPLRSAPDPRSTPPRFRSEFAQGRLSLRLKSGCARDDANEVQTAENQTEHYPVSRCEPLAGI